MLFCVVLCLILYVCGFCSVICLCLVKIDRNQMPSWFVNCPDIILNGLWTMLLTGSHVKWDPETKGGMLGFGIHSPFKMEDMSTWLPLSPRQRRTLGLSLPACFTSSHLGVKTPVFTLIGHCTAQDPWAHRPYKREKCTSSLSLFFQRFSEGAAAPLNLSPLLLGGSRKELPLLWNPSPLSSSPGATPQLSNLQEACTRQNTSTGSAARAYRLKDSRTN